MTPTIRQQTLLLALLPMLIVAALLDSYFIYSRISSLEASMVERAALIADQVGVSSEFALFSGNIEVLQRESNNALKQRDVVAVTILDITGRAVMTVGEVVSNHEKSALVGNPLTGVVLERDDYFWFKSVIYSQTVVLNDLELDGGAVTQKQPVGFVLLKTSKHRLQQEKWMVVGVSLIISLLMMVFVAIVVVRVSRRIVHPIMALNRVARRIGEGDLSVRLSPAPVIRELKELATSINEMSLQLQQDRLVLEGQKELLRENQERLNQIISTMPVALFIKDANSRFTLLNSACEAQWGVLSDSLLNTRGDHIFPKEDMTRYLEDDKQVFAGRKLCNFEEQVWNAQIKQYRTLQTFKKPVYDTKGLPLYLLCMSVDITERKRAETQLKQLNEQLEVRIEEATRAVRQKKEDAENASQHKSRFLAAASHDLRQPMHALGLFMGELQSKLTTVEQRKIADKVEESVDALSNLLDSLLDISKLDAGVVTPNVTTFSISNLLNRITQHYGPLARCHGVVLRVISCNQVVQSDPILLERIVVNLVSNALRYTPVGGKVALLCRHRDGKLAIEIRDSGIGISEKEQENIFREFVQLANKERDRSKGLGLGLAIVERVAKLLDHSITLRSAPGKGSVFSVLVPLVEASPKVVEALPAAIEGPISATNTGFEHINVLVVDDDALVRTSTQGIIESWGCSVSMASTLREVREFHGKADFDLIICDYRLPDGDGLELAAWIGENFKTQPVFVLVSGDTSPEILSKVNAQQIQLLHKPVRPAKLRSLIQFLLKQKAGK